MEVAIAGWWAVLRRVGVGGGGFGFKAASSQICKGGAEPWGPLGGVERCVLTVGGVGISGVIDVVCADRM